MVQTPSLVPHSSIALEPKQPTITQNGSQITRPLHQIRLLSTLPCILNFLHFPSMTPIISQSLTKPTATPNIKEKTTLVVVNKMEKQRKSSEKLEKRIKPEPINGIGEKILIEEPKCPSLSNSLLIGGGGEGGDERRRSSSFSSYSKIELGEFFSELGAQIVTTDMPPFMQTHAVACVRKAYDSLDKFSSKTLASILKKEFDVVYGPAWHCIVGTSFGTFVTHSVGGFLYFSLDHHRNNKLYFLLFKTTVKRSSDD